MARKDTQEQTISTSRIEAFSDGVFAIVITLLVLELHVPELSVKNDWYELLNSISNLLPKFVSFTMSFFFVSVFWVSHHQFFHSLNFSKRGLLWINTGFLFFVTFIPFPTGILGAYYKNITAVIFFGLTLLAASLTFAILRWYGWSGETSEKFDKKSYKSAVVRSFLLPFLYATGIVFAFYSTYISITVYFLTPVLLIKPIKLITVSPYKENMEV